MALKNMIKLGDSVTFGHAGGEKTKGKVIKLNPKTAHVKTANGQVFGVSYGLIQKPSKKKPSALQSSKSKSNPPNLTKKGERMYEHIKKGYEEVGDKRAKEIAARTVYTMARTTPGLLKKKNPSVRSKSSKRKKSILTDVSKIQLRSMERMLVDLSKKREGGLEPDTRELLRDIRRELRKRK